MPRHVRRSPLGPRRTLRLALLLAAVAAIALALTGAIGPAAAAPVDVPEVLVVR